MIEGHFIVLEGIDGAGTSTQCELLGSAMRKRGLPVHLTREPSDGPIGAMIRQVLRGRLVVAGVSGARAPSAATMALLFAADRSDHLDAEVFPNLMDGVTVVSDRYDHSSVAYQSAGDPTATDEVAWIRTINKHVRRPDLVIVLDVHEEVAQRRRRERAGRPELYEESEFQQRLSEFYRTLEKHFPEDRIVHINGEKDVSEVHREVLAAVDALRARG